MSVTVLTDARDHMIGQLYDLSPGDEMLKQAQAIQTIAEVDLNYRRLEFEIDKEEARALEKAKEYACLEYDRQLRWVELGIKLLDVVLDPMAVLRKTSMNNKTRIKRDIMGYTFEETGVIGSHTLNNSQKDKYD